MFSPNRPRPTVKLKDEEVRALYTDFLKILEQCDDVEIDFDLGCDALYVYGERLDTTLLPRTYHVAPDILVDIYPKECVVAGVEVLSCVPLIRNVADKSLIAWWDGLEFGETIEVGGKQIARLLRAISA